MAGYESVMEGERDSRIGEAMALYSLDGELLRATSAARRLLSSVTGLRERLGEMVRARRPADSSRWPDTGMDIAGREYGIRATIMEPARPGSKPTVLIALDPEWTMPRTGALHRRYGLTKREVDVARLIMHRCSNLEIAEHLGISRHTARHHVQSVLLKLGVHSRAEARRALRRMQRSDPPDV